ncbi:hypothetical protein [Amycolatopsis sp. SID8362]|uniref:hypothetical protein n=1 Tax=Amycolatopsis sp. SID8362 TaxID=2690346 RepID=UPI00136BBC0F|nr:hypothetical protein [Amycolatopsis sp. SID8362]NBH10960.1 hypothetical protein [Amycolatopsis sp. SID8362]NED47651.1 hypothetical protein [Amycolatopsis sp. SID8362]
MRTDPVTATVVRLGIVAPSRGRTARAVHLGVTLDAVLDEVFERVPVPYRTPTWFRRAEGDATTLIIPPTVPHGWIAAELVALLAGALRRRNRHLNEFGKLRLRVAADHGDVVLRPPHFGGAAVALATWLCAAEELKAAIAAAPELDLLLIVSDRFHTAVADDPGYRRIVVPAGGEREIAWLGPGPDTGTRNTGTGGGLAPS